MFLAPKTEPASLSSEQTYLEGVFCQKRFLSSRMENCISNGVFYLVSVVHCKWFVVVGLHTFNCDYSCTWKKFSGQPRSCGCTKAERRNKEKQCSRSTNSYALRQKSLKNYRNPVLSVEVLQTQTSIRSDFLFLVRTNEFIISNFQPV